MYDRVENSRQTQPGALSPRPASSAEWQNLALDTLSRLTRQFALYPDCGKLIDLVLLSMTGQLSATGAFACFLSSPEASQSIIYRGAGIMYRQNSLQGLLDSPEYRQYFAEHPSPIGVNDLMEDTQTPPGIQEILREAKVAAIVSMIIGDSLLGILGLARKVDRSAFSKSDLSLLGTLADTISPLLSNSLLYGRLDAQNRWHRDVIDSVRQGVLVFTDSLYLKQANEQARLVFATLDHNISWENTAVSMEDLFDTRTFPEWQDFIKSACRGKGTSGAENLVANDGEGDRFFLVRVSRTSERGPEQRDVIVTFDEITEQRNAERRMFEMEKFAEKGIMAASIAHELNNHLALILGGIELAEIASNREDLEKTRQSLEKLKKHSLAMERFTAGLTDYSRSVSEKTDCDLNRIVKDVISFARIQKRFSGIGLSVNLGPRLPRIKADADQLAQLLVNLLNNAADAIKDAKEENGAIKVTTENDDDAISITIRDNGIGIPDDLKDKLFKTRFTTKDYGHGFGMVTCGRILRLHGAQYSVESEPQKGTSIKMDFPIN